MPSLQVVAGRLQRALHNFLETFPLFAVAVLALWYAGSVLRVHPNYLAYFNEAAGGPAQGWRWLVDSNVDWGQDFDALSQRIHPADSRVRMLSAATPAWYVAFDLLAEGETDLRAQPLGERRKRLERLLKGVKPPM